MLSGMHPPDNSEELRMVGGPQLRRGYSGDKEAFSPGNEPFSQRLV